MLEVCLNLVGAIQNSRVLVILQHRFYGKSIPFRGNKDVAYSNTSTLGYLTSTQALADYAMVITDLKKNLSAVDSPVVVLGGSYGGTIGALASSSPILNFDDITSPYSFNNIITRDFKSESENCYKVIKESWQQIEDTAKHQRGLDILLKSFRICNPMISMCLGPAYLLESKILTERAWNIAGLHGDGHAHERQHQGEHIPGLRVCLCESARALQSRLRCRA
ncbi:hypothetical protein CRG98_032573 [Punica granatum]|uniref:Serine carboxypeptidase S28 family protein n=1 Tax=Punica granatum TaxID=22663 RepID=A0A2I0ISR5_PUNGR|nr:hypothetical protein CRG98_032573 [Punica granatum]